MPSIVLNRDGINAKLLSPKLSEDDRDFIRGAIEQPIGGREYYVRVKDSERIRELLQVTEGVEAF